MPKAQGTSHDTPQLAWLRENEDACVLRLCEWLRMPSVSTDPAYAPDVRRAAEWCRDHLAASGLESDLSETDGHPVVYAHAPGASGYEGPHVLFYGHYDVQPPDPIDKWSSGPFEPVVENDRVVARGASDDKGQVAMFLEALRAWKQTTGQVAGGVKLTVLIEGEEESGSVNLEKWIDAHADELRACDVCLISDTGMLAIDRPAITYGVRGLTYTEVTLQGPSHDLHSGMWGGKCPNPINELTKVLGQLWDADQRVTIPGFYNGVREPSATEREAWAKLGIDPGEALAGIGLPPEADLGEAGWSAIEREWARPTAEINGIIGGYTGAGAKTVIPTHATAKVSFRLVADQDPDRVRQGFFEWLEQRTPPGCSWTLVDHGGGWPVTTPVDSPTLREAVAAIEAVTGHRVELIKTGGSIPIGGLLKERLGIDTVFMGFGLENDRVHSPNEKFDLACFRMGAAAHAELLRRLGAGLAGS